MTRVGRSRLTRLLITWGAWVTADGAVLITASVLALQVGGPWAVGLVGIARVLPAALLSGFVAGLADRLPRPRLLMITFGGWCLVALALAWCAWQTAPLPALITVVAAGSALSCLVKPTLQALLPQLVDDPGRLVTANTAWTTIEGVGTVAGAALCGAAIALLGTAWTFVLVAVVCLVAAVAGGSIVSSFQPVPTTADAPEVRRLLDGLHGLTRRGPGVIFGLFMAQTAMRGLVNVYLVVLATGGPGGSEAQVGGLFAAIGIGGLFGAVAGFARPSRSAGRFAVGIGLWGLPIMVIGLWSGPGVAWVALAVLGFGNAVADIYGYSLLNRFLPDHEAGRAWGAFHAVGAASLAAGSLAAPALISLLGLPGAMIATGALLALAPVLAWARLRTVDQTATVDAGLLATFAATDLLAPLAPIALERLARSAVPVRAAPGDVLVAEGESADRFFVLTAGTVSVQRRGLEVRRLAAPGAFGEIGLLTGRSRSATVRAETPAQLYAVGAHLFVAAVTGHRPTAANAISLVDATLAADQRADQVATDPVHPPQRPDGA